MTGSSSNSSPPKSVTDYTSALGNLERSRALAQLDHRYETINPPVESGNTGPRTIYIFDTNVCRSFLDPREDVFLNAAGISGLFGGNHGDTVERMTLRYMFHGLLPGQDKEPIFLTPSHWNELLTQIEVLLRKGGRSVIEIQHDLSEDTLKLLRDAESPEELVRLAEELKVARSLQELGDAISLVNRIEILFGKENAKGRLRRFDHAVAATLSEVWREASSLVSWRVETDWRRTISKLKYDAIRNRLSSRNTRQREEELRRHQRAINNDAASMALIETLYLVDPYAGGEEPRRQYLFVTSDNALSEACEVHKARLEQNGIPSFVRSPASFMPFAHYEYFHEVMTSQPETTQAYKETSGRINDAIISLRSATGNRRQHELQPAKVRELRSNWDEAANLLSIIGNEQFVDDFSGQNNAEKVKRTYEYLAYEKIGSAIEEVLQAKMGQVTVRHEIASIRSALKQLPELLRPPLEGTSDPRAPIHFLATDVLKQLREANITQCNRLSDFLRELRLDAAETKKKSEQTADFLRSRWRVGIIPSTEIVLLTAVLLTSAGLWGVALECANQARRKARGRTFASRSTRNQRHSETSTTTNYKPSAFF